MVFTLKIQVSPKHEVFRVRIDQVEITFEDVRTMIQNVVPVYNAGQAKYLDEEGDLCTLHEAGFTDFLETSRLIGNGRLLKLQVDTTGPVCLRSPEFGMEQTRGECRIRSIQFEGFYIQVSEVQGYQRCGWKRHVFAAPLSAPSLKVSGEGKSRFEMETVGKYVRFKNSEFADTYLQVSDVVCEHVKRLVFAGPLDAPYKPFHITSGHFKSLFEIEQVEGHVRLRSAQFTGMYIQTSEREGLDGIGWKRQVFAGPLDLKVPMRISANQKSLFSME